MSRWTEQAPTGIPDISNYLLSLLPACLSERHIYIGSRLLHLLHVIFPNTQHVTKSCWFYRLIPLKSFFMPLTEMQEEQPVNQYSCLRSFPVSHPTTTVIFLNICSSLVSNYISFYKKKMVISILFQFKNYSQTFHQNHQRGLKPPLWFHH